MKTFALIALILACSCNDKSEAPAPPAKAASTTLTAVQPDDCAMTRKLSAMVPEELIGKCECFDGVNENCHGPKNTEIIWISRKPGELPTITVGLDWSQRAPQTPPAAPVSAPAPKAAPQTKK